MPTLLAAPSSTQSERGLDGHSLRARIWSGLPGVVACRTERSRSCPPLDRHHPSPEGQVGRGTRRTPTSAWGLRSCWSRLSWFCVNWPGRRQTMPGVDWHGISGRGVGPLLWIAMVTLACAALRSSFWQVRAESFRLRSRSPVVTSRLFLLSPRMAPGRQHDGRLDTSGGGS